MKNAIFFLLFSLVFTTPLSARDMSTLYAEATLKYWQPRNAEDISGNFENVILPHLTPQERHVLRNVKIEFPLKGAEGEIFEFYTKGSTVIMPILSLRFFGDLSLASSWLWANGYSLSTIPQYISMLKYKPADKFPDKRYPQPLKTLGIPDNARDDPKVMDVLSKGYSTGVIFILCHELGHIYHRHPSYSTAADEQIRENERENEVEADRFAITIMRRMGDLPGGVALWFLSFAYWDWLRGDFSDDEEWKKRLKTRTHPLTARRMQALAEEIEKGAADFARTQAVYSDGLKRARSIAGDIAKVGKILEHANLQRIIRTQGLETDPTMLEPRHSDVYVVKPLPGTSPEVPFDGVYEGKLTSSKNPDGVETRIIFTRHENQVFGRYTYDGAYGTMNGSVEGDSLFFDWQEGSTDGKGKLRVIDKGRAFTGTWGDRESRDNGGVWHGRR